ncbi:ACT domain-containing protein [Aliivibrio fischeri]|uniref:ACT domain-containing protein n=1 Tax=Aliivibrio fischeri TaxID=668 RepID=UPI0012D99023|nr:ACT domain-containing protein [Aliivibrio fischeri]MUI56061.1 ACT domain-containing protein [Aliivibrio fischeri]
MSGVFELDELLKTMKPELLTQEYVFCSVEGELKEYIRLNPIGTFVEQEGLTLVLEKDVAFKANIPSDGVFRQITLTVHSSLDAVGLTAAVSTKLASKGINANVVAAFYHDHIFVPSSKAELALSALKEIE